MADAKYVLMQWKFAIPGLALLALLSGCSDGASSAGRPALQGPVKEQPAVEEPARLASEHLPNPVRIHERVLSGGLPEGDAAFAELAEWGIKTVISVDGMTPDVEMASRYGLRYVHLPHGYDGISEQRVHELAKAVRDLEGPVYIHCHHGKHRSPAAASVACVSAGLVSAERAVSILELAGTNPHYQGLYEAASKARKLDDALLDALEVEFKAVQQIPPMAEAMVHMSHAHDRLKRVAKHGWRTPPDHPDLTPAHEALLLRELFTELLRTEEVEAQPADFRAWLTSSEQAAIELQSVLLAWSREHGSGEPPQRADELATRIAEDCSACHAKYRDAPLSTKQR